VSAGEICCLLGPSGCGKTTALRIIAGFEDPEYGSVHIGDDTVVGPGVNLPPDRRRVGMVFQDYALFPHMTVRANVAFGIGKGAATRVAEILELVGLEAMGDRMPHQLSGGEQQRVALARALAPSPSVILLDEPFSNLDASLRDRMRRDVRLILKETGSTVVFVTHDQEEALAMADTVAVMRHGRVLQIGAPRDVYKSPANPWVAGFIGESTLIEGTAETGIVTTPIGRFPHASKLRGPVLVMVRPEWIHPVPSMEGRATIVDQEFYGHDRLVTLELEDGRRLTSRLAGTPLIEVGDRVEIGIDEVVLFPAG
jgi:iron(III) transport system ATP-binding protein